MSAATNVRFPVLFTTLAISSAALGLTSLRPVRDELSKFFGRKTVRYSWRILALVLAYYNVKNLPGVWHIRVLRGIIYQLYLQPNPQPPEHLFAPVVTSSYNSLYDCDYNIHKSNSTYFADLDVSRAHLISCIIRTGLARLNKGDREGLAARSETPRGRYFIALGGVACFFHRQIDPLQSFDIYTRVLAWDRKWLYSVSHIVPKGSVKPGSYVLQPWKRSKRRPGTAENKQQESDEDLKKLIYATSVARYCFKKGRMTINPEIVLERSYLLPPRPAGVSLPPRAEAADGLTPAETPATPALDSSPETAAADLTDRLTDVAGGAENNSSAWTWDDMENERLRGLRIAAHFEALGEAHGELRADEVLGQFGDYW